MPIKVQRALDWEVELIPSPTTKAKKTKITIWLTHLW